MNTPPKEKLEPIVSSSTHQGLFSFALHIALVGLLVMFFAAAGDAMQTPVAIFLSGVLVSIAIMHRPLK